MSLKTNTTALKLIGIAVYTITLFAVLFDPTEAALGSQFMDIGPVFLVIAQILGNITWILGVCYMLITVFCVIFMLNDELYFNVLKEAAENGTMNNYRKSWTEIPIFIFAMSVALLCLGSGFWFTGFFFMAALILCRLMGLKVRKSVAFNDYIGNK